MQPFVGILHLGALENGYNFAFVWWANVHFPVHCIPRERLYLSSDFLRFKKKEVGSVRPDCTFPYGSISHISGDQRPHVPVASELDSEIHNIFSSQKVPWDSAALTKRWILSESSTRRLGYLTSAFRFLPIAVVYCGPISEPADHHQMLLNRGDGRWYELFRGHGVFEWPRNWGSFKEAWSSIRKGWIKNVSVFISGWQRFLFSLLLFTWG